MEGLRDLLHLARAAGTQGMAKEARGGFGALWDPVSCGAQLGSLGTF